jgi:cytochrome c553
MFKPILVLVAGIACGLPPALAADGNPLTGKKRAAMCAGCHGIPGYRTTFPDNYPVPKLGGQHAEYIATALKAYRSGERKHSTMRSVAASLSDQDIADIAAYYAGAKK